MAPIIRDSNWKLYLHNTWVHPPQPSLYSCQESHRGIDSEEATCKGEIQYILFTVTIKKRLFIHHQTIMVCLWPPELLQFFHRILKSPVPTQCQAAGYLNVMKQGLTLAVPSLNLETNKHENNNCMNSFNCVNTFCNVFILHSIWLVFVLHFNMIPIL